jgi:hypothetical protein
MGIVYYSFPTPQLVERSAIRSTLIIIHFVLLAISPTTEIDFPCQETQKASSTGTVGVKLLFQVFFSTGKSSDRFTGARGCRGV